MILPGGWHRAVAELGLGAVCPTESALTCRRQGGTTSRCSRRRRSGLEGWRDPSPCGVRPSCVHRCAPAAGGYNGNHLRHLRTCAHKLWGEYLVNIESQYSTRV
eukprot:scaffold46705_cov36-Phaeocystis_antarctica.AAC.2